MVQVSPAAITPDVPLDGHVMNGLTDQDPAPAALQRRCGTVRDLTGTHAATTRRAPHVHRAASLCGDAAAAAKRERAGRDGEQVAARGEQGRRPGRARARGLDRRGLGRRRDGAVRLGS
jgi:hypothetical protein